MKKVKLLMSVVLLTVCLTGCSQNNIKNLSERINQIELTGNLITYTAYYHNVIEYDKDKDSGIAHLFEKDRKLFAEYTGNIKYGIDLSKVNIKVNGNEINVFIPKATTIGEPNVDRDDFDSKNFIESSDSILNRNPITVDDSSSAFDQAQREIKQVAAKDSKILAMAQKRAKVLIEENIKQCSGISEKSYNINWEYEQ